MRARTLARSWRGLRLQQSYLEILDDFAQAIFQVGCRLPAEPLPGDADIRTAAFRVVTRSG
jgi:hypothetical protein